MLPPDQRYADDVGDPCGRGERPVRQNLPLLPALALDLVEALSEPKDLILWAGRCAIAAGAVVSGWLVAIGARRQVVERSRDRLLTVGLASAELIPLWSPQAGLSKRDIHRGRVAARPEPQIAAEREIGSEWRGIARPVAFPKSSDSVSVGGREHPVEQVWEMQRWGLLSVSRHARGVLGDWLLRAKDLSVQLAELDRPLFQCGRRPARWWPVTVRNRPRSYLSIWPFVRPPGGSTPRAKPRKPVPDGESSQ